jgi:Skp family chaperone for outer membrane proteins
MGRRNEWSALLGRANKTEQDTKRIEVLQELAGKSGSAVTKIANDLFNAIKLRQEEIEKQYTDRANNVIKAVAAEKKLALVVRKKAIVWNSDAVIDITEEVIKRLNETAPAG